MACDLERFKRFFHRMLEEGVYFAPSAFETGFMSAAHSPAEWGDQFAARRRLAFDELLSWVHDNQRPTPGLLPGSPPPPEKNPPKPKNPGKPE